MLFTNVLRYPRLLLAAEPTKLDLITLLIGILSAIASGIPFPLIGIIFGQLLDDFNEATCDATQAREDGAQGDINDKILLIVYLAIAQFILIYAHLTCWGMTGARLAQRLREAYLGNLLRQEPSYFDKLPPGEVASRLNNDIQTIRSGTSEKVGICLASLSFFVTAYVVAFIKDHHLAAMLVSLVPAYFLMSFIGSHYIEKYSSIMSDYAASAASIASEALSNVVVVHAFQANERLEEKFSDTLKHAEAQGLRKANAVGIQAGFLYFIAYAANGLAFWQGSKHIAETVEGTSKVTTVGATFTVIFILVEGEYNSARVGILKLIIAKATLLLSQVAPFLHLFSGAVASYNKLYEDMLRKSQIDGTSASGHQPSRAQGSFELQNVSFIYPSRPDVTVLDDISLRIPAKKHTAVVGFSGSGKSTIASLLLRLYDPVAGQVLSDGHDIRTLNLSYLRSHISLVQQESSLLDRSLLENIAHGLVNSSKPEHQDLKDVLLSGGISEVAEEVRNGMDLMLSAQAKSEKHVVIVRLVQEAAALADAADFVDSLPHGYGTTVGSSGRLISGGQKQRIALARALVKDPTVLILDEATASLDSTSEQRIQKAVASIATGRTVITIAHRLSTIVGADNIVVLHKGHIEEQGTHSELMAAGGAYAKLVHMQSLATPDEGHQSEKAENVTTLEKLSLIDSRPSVREPDSEKDVIVREQLIDDSTVTDDEVATPPKSLWALLRGYAPALRPHLLVIIAALLGSTIVGGAFSAEAVIFGNTVGSLNLCESPDFIREKGEFFGLLFFALAIIEFFGNIISWSGFGWVSEKVVYTVRVLSFRSLFEQDMQWHQSNGRTPALLLSYITRDGNALAGLSGSVIGTLFSITVNLVAAIILTHIIAWRIALVCLALVPLLLGAGLMELRVLGQFEEKHENAYTKSVDLGVEAISSIKTIASLSLEQETLETYRRSLKGPKKETLKVTLTASFFQAMTYFFGASNIQSHGLNDLNADLWLGNLVNALAYWWGAKQILAGNYTQTQFLIVVFSLLVSALLWSQMFALAPELSASRAAMARILGLIELGSDKMQSRVHRLSRASSIMPSDAEAAGEPKASTVASESPSSIQLRDVGFAYPARLDVPVLKGLSMDIKPGTFCALIGPSGAGKSTVISLIERLYTPQTGSIVIDGVDITKSRNVAFRNSIALVPQESVLFEGTIEFNIALGARTNQVVSLDDIVAACKLANIHETIASLPDGYQTLCGPNGSQFSGGQKQRLSIARALVRKPRLLILDESTSALDAESEKLLEEGLDKATKGITVIAIAHRLRTIRKANRIFLIEDGKCVAHGTHEELMRRSESYRLNVMHQTIAV
jgi:ABC-type multidrug transport system fused ATPase/permease subunit